MQFAEGRMKKKVMGAVEAIGEGVGQGDLRRRPRRRTDHARALRAAGTHIADDRMADPRAPSKNASSAARPRVAATRCSCAAKAAGSSTATGAAISISRRRRASRCSGTAIRASARPSRGRPRTLMLCPNYLYNDVRAEFAEALVDVLPAAPAARLSRQQRRRSRRRRAQVRAPRDRATGVRRRPPKGSTAARSARSR